MKESCWKSTCVVWITPLAMLYLSLSHFAIIPSHRMENVSCILFTSRWNPSRPYRASPRLGVSLKQNWAPLSGSFQKQIANKWHNTYPLWQTSDNFILWLQISTSVNGLMIFSFLLRRLCLQPVWFMLAVYNCWLVWLNPLQIPVSPWIRLFWLTWDLGWNKYSPWFFTSANIDVKLFCRCRLAFLTSLGSVTLTPQCYKCLGCSVYALFPTTCILPE